MHLTFMDIKPRGAQTGLETPSLWITTSWKTVSLLNCTVKSCLVRITSTTRKWSNLKDKSWLGLTCSHSLEVWQVCCSVHAQWLDGYSMTINGRPNRLGQYSQGETRRTINRNKRFPSSADYPSWTTSGQRRNWTMILMMWIYRTKKSTTGVDVTSFTRLWTFSE